MARVPAKRVDLLGAQRRVFHRADGGELRLAAPYNGPRQYRCSVCWRDPPACAGFWKVESIARMTDADIALRFEIDDEDTPIIELEGI